jgi:NAD(P)-dependent dehydrogenase (short-subunit alcohol dehydrogenase family)
MKDQPVAVITGASAGVGLATAKALLANGWRVIGTGRDAERCARAQTELQGIAPDPALAVVLQADLAEMHEVVALAKEILALTQRVDTLINNAGGACAHYRLTSDGNEYTLAGNHFGHFLLTQQLLPTLRATAQMRGEGAVRVISVSSTGHEYAPATNWEDSTQPQAYVSGEAYCRAKLANILFTRELARRVAADGIVAHAMHPGVVASNFISHLDDTMRAHMETLDGDPPEVPAKTLVWLATDPEPGRCSGLYWHDCKHVEPSPTAKDDDQAAQLWFVSEAVVRRAMT